MKYLSSIYLVLIIFNVFVWYWALQGREDQTLNLYFLNVGQGDGSLVMLPGKVKILIDGGPGKEILNPLSKVLSPTDRYIDLVLLSHPQLDHFSGLIPVLERYRVGAFIYNGREGTASAWKDLVRVLAEKKIKTVVLKEGSRIKYEDNDIQFLSPSNNFLGSKELNDATLVAELTSESSKTLFTADIGFKVENYLTNNYETDIDILKVAHHGSKYSSGLSFLNKATPKISVIQVGRNNYGHPTKEALGRLSSVGSSIYRNDLNGTVHLRVKDGLISVFTER